MNENESAALRPAPAPGTTADDDTTVEFLTEIIDYFERLKHRAKVRGGPDTAAMQVAEEAIGLCRDALADAVRRRAAPPKDADYRRGRRD